LVVDDEPPIRKITRRTLEANGYRVLDAADGNAAIAQAADHSGDLSAAIIDMNMPGMDGLAVMRELYRLAPAVRLIGSTGLPTDRAPLEAAGMRAFLTKPYSAESLLATVRQVIDGP
jgi:CheY-like chemotaxis protein